MCTAGRGRSSRGRERLSGDLLVGRECRSVHDLDGSYRFEVGSECSALSGSTRGLLRLVVFCRNWEKKKRRTGMPCTELRLTVLIVPRH